MTFGDHLKVAAFQGQVWVVRIVNPEPTQTNSKENTQNPLTPSHLSTKEPVGKVLHLGPFFENPPVFLTRKSGFS